MLKPDFARSVFINCPFDEKHAPLLEACVFCVVYLGFVPRLANERLEAGENRLDKIFGMIAGSKYSIHDLSRTRASNGGEFFRMNMPFEFGVDVGLRRSGKPPFDSKMFLIFEKQQYDLKRALSDIAGQDVEHHKDDYEVVMRKTRDFFRVEAGVPAPGPTRLLADYGTFQGWMIEKKIYEGHSEEEALTVPTKERIDEMVAWREAGLPAEFRP